MKLEQQEKIVLSVYNNRSFTKAAAELGVSQPALSASVNKLENELGIRIFERKKTPLCPTEEGLVYIEYLKKLRLDYKECFSKINDIINSRNRTVTIGAPVAYANTFIPDKIAMFNNLYPDCRVAVKAAAISELVEMSGDGEVDCFISTSSNLESNFITKVIESEKLYLCVPKSWEVNRQLTKYQINADDSGSGFDICTDRIKDWTVFSGMKLINLDEKKPLQRTINEFILKENITPVNSITVDQAVSGVNLAVHGMGMTFASDVAIRGVKDAGALCIYALPEYIESRPIYLAYNSSNYVSDMCRKFMDMLTK